jgi:hypothetical protein
MKLLKVFGITITLLLAISQTAPAQSWKTAPTYDAVKDFSTQSNPNGVWSYGYLTSWGAPLTLFAWGGTCDISGISWWFTSQCQGCTSVFHNDTTKTVCWASVCEPPSYLGLNPAGYLSVLRWTAPSSGTFLVQVSAEGLDCCTTSTYFHVLLNSKHSFLKAPITSYQWPLSFHPRAWRLSAGDTVDFIVDEGKDGDWHSDSTGVEVKIWSLGQKGERQ